MGVTDSEIYNIEYMLYRCTCSKLIVGEEDSEFKGNGAGNWHVHNSTHLHCPLSLYCMVECLLQTHHHSNWRKRHTLCTSVRNNQSSSSRISISPRVGSSLILLSSPFLLRLTKNDSVFSSVSSLVMETFTQL